MNSEILRFYKAHVPIDEEKACSDEVKTSCPFHSDNNPSFSINLDTGLFKCHTQGCAGNAGGNMYQFYQLIHKEDGMSAEQAKDEVLAEYKVGTSKPVAAEKAKAKPIANFPVSEEEVEAAHRCLLSKEGIMSILRDEFLWTDETIKENQLGFNDNRIWIPIRENRQLVNIRKYSRNPRNGSKVVSVSGFGSARLWPLEAMEHAEIYLFEGEKDRMLASQYGINAVTVTGGAGTFELKWIPLLRGKHLRICYDIDTAGREGAKKVANLVMNIAASVKIITLPLTEPANADFTDYMKSGKTIQDFHELVDNTPTKQPPETREISDDVIEVHTEDAIKKELFCRRLKTKVRVISSRLPAIIPKGLIFSCRRNAKEKCLFCPHTETGEATLALDERSEILLRYLSSGVRDDKMIHKDAFEPPCTLTKNYTVIESVSQRSVEQVDVAPIIDDLDITENMYQRFDEYKMYVIDKRLDVNSDYEIDFVLYKHPVDREVTSIIYKADPCQSSLNCFTLNADLITKLKEFQSEENTSETEPHIQGHN